jgi:hypothetical protein
MSSFQLQSVLLILFLFNTLLSKTPKLSVYCEHMRDLPRLYLKIKFTEITDLFLQLIITCDKKT